MGVATAGERRGKEGAMGDVSSRSIGSVIPFPASDMRPARPPLPPEHPRGEILLFTGIRYERQAEPSPAPIDPGRRPPRRRRG
jgi:hypothetical protein